MKKRYNLSDALSAVEASTVKNGDCLECSLAPSTNGGYPRVKCDGKLWRVSRLILFVRHGSLSRWEFACHTCDSPKCVRPDHIFLGSPKENVADSMAKGRFVPPPVHYGPKASNPIPSRARYHSDDGLSLERITKRNKRRLSMERWARNNPDRFKALRAASNASRRAIKILSLLMFVIAAVNASVSDDLKLLEGFRSEAYLDTTGHYTVGFGRRCVQGAQMSREQAALALNGDIATAERGARKLWPSFANHSQQVQDALVEIVFQIGAAGASKFVRFGAAIAARDYQSAGAELLSSKWSKQTPNRVKFLVGKLAY